MKLKNHNREIRNIRVDLIDVLNHRERNQAVFDKIVENIKAVGLKKPIVVAPRKMKDGTDRFFLVCGEGRLKAHKILKREEISAQVVGVTDEDGYILSLIENIVRVKQKPLDMFKKVARMRDEGCSTDDISKRTGLSYPYLTEMFKLLDKGEERLLVAVDKGQIPINAAIAIVEAGENDIAVQTALQEAYESGKLKGMNLYAARKILERRRVHGPSTKDFKSPHNSKKREVSSASLVRTFQREVERQKMMIRKSERTQQCLSFVTGSLRNLYADENFVNLLRAEGLHSLPTYLAQKIWANGVH